MASETIRLEAATGAALKKAFGSVRKQASPVSVELPSGAASLDHPDEVLVLVLWQNSGLVQRIGVAGRAVDMRELRLRLVGAEAAVDQLAQETVAPSPQLTDAEAAALDAVGLVEGDGPLPGAVEKSRVEYELLIKQSLTLDKAAKALAVNPSRLRQRLSEGTLYGIKDGPSWRIPKFQLDARRKKLVRGIDKVMPHVRREVHPLAVVSWFSSAHQDLVVGDDETPVSPVQWLAGGRSPAVVAELAEEI